MALLLIQKDIPYLKNSIYNRQKYRILRHIDVYIEFEIIKCLLDLILLGMIEKLRKLFSLNVDILTQ